MKRIILNIIFLAAILGSLQAFAGSMANTAQSVKSQSNIHLKFVDFQNNLMDGYLLRLFVMTEDDTSDNDDENSGKSSQTQSTCSHSDLASFPYLNLVSYSKEYGTFPTVPVYIVLGVFRI